MYKKCLLSSPDLNAQVPIVCMFIHLFVKYSRFHLLLKNHHANFIQTWHKASFGKRIQVSPNKGPHPFPTGDDNKIAQKKYIDETWQSSPLNPLDQLNLAQSIQCSKMVARVHQEHFLHYQSHQALFWTWCLFSCFFKIAMIDDWTSFMSWLISNVKKTIMK